MNWPQHPKWNQPRKGARDAARHSRSRSQNSLNAETQKRKQPDGSAKSREVKLGCVFTQTAVDAKGPPIRDPDATTYLSSFRPLDEFGGRMRTAALRRGMASAPGGAVLSDGARCNWEVARSNFPSALQMLDFYHGRAHVGNWVHPLEAKDSPAAQQQRRQWKKRLLTAVNPSSAIRASVRA